MTSDERPTEHPHIVRKPGTCGGLPIIRGSRTTVGHMAFLWRNHETIENILRDHPHVAPSAIFDALSYYLDHKEEIDQEMEGEADIKPGRLPRDAANGSLPVSNPVELG